MNGVGTAPSAGDGARPRVLLVSGADSNYAGFLCDMLRSFHSFPESAAIDIACLDFGLAPADRLRLREYAGSIAEPAAHLDIAANPSRLHVSLLVRPYLRENFPGYDIYLWIDSDVWLQRWSPIEAYLRGAMDAGMAVAHERERGYRFQGWLFGWTAKHMLLGYGPLEAGYLLSRRHLNAGIFAIRSDAPQWDAWIGRYRRAYQRTGSPAPHDQFALNQAIYGGLLGGGTRAAILPATANWICDRGVPMWNDAEAAFCLPYPPHTVIGALHLAGPAKGKEYLIRRTGGGAFTTRLTLGARPPD